MSRHVVDSMPNCTIYLRFAVSASQTKTFQTTIGCIQFSIGTQLPVQLIRTGNTKAFLAMSKVGLPLMGNAAGIVVARINRSFKFILTKYLNKTHILMFIPKRDLKQEKRSSCKNSHPKCIKTINFDRFLRKGAKCFNKVLNYAIDNVVPFCLLLNS